MDPLRLPTVPPPAPATHPWRDRMLIAIVAVLLPVMAALDPLRGAAIKWEQRRAATWPPVAMLASPATFGAAFGQAFADRFGMRSALIVAQHWALVDIFGVSPVDNVMIGRDGWLFWLGEDARSLDRHYRGTRTVPDFEAEAYVAEVKRRHEYLQSRGIAYLTMIVPEKFTIYPEYLPSWVAPGRNPTLLARTMDRLAEDGSVPYVDLRPVLRAAKGREHALLPDRLALEPRRSGRGLRRDHASRADPAAGTTRVHRPTGAPAVHPRPRCLLGRSRQSHGHPVSLHGARLPAASQGNPGSPRRRPASPDRSVRTRTATSGSTSTRTPTCRGWS